MPRPDPIAEARRYLHDEEAHEWPADDYDAILEAVWDALVDKFGDDGGMLLNVYDNIQGQYRRGERCSVCGMTQKQSAAANYDCIMEC